jgi:glycerate kinase
MPVSILVAPTAFKGSLGPRVVAEALAEGARRVAPGALVLACPLADGGDGLLDAVLAPGALREPVTVTGPLGQPVEGEIGWIDEATVIIESASACGLRLLPVRERKPQVTTSRGVGELVAVAAERGAATVVVGLGGSATVDGGAGAARALGWRLKDASGQELPEGGGALAALAALEPGWTLSARLVALADVANPLVGPEGAARVFGPQKGASAADVERLDAGLSRLAELMARYGRPELGALPGGGAAGGLGAGLAFFAGAELVAGAGWVLERVGFDAALARADLVLTGEGAVDLTSLAGKAVGEVLRRARAARKRTVVVAGALRGGIELAWPDVRMLAGDGTLLDGPAITRLAERGVREALGLPRA